MAAFTSAEHGTMRALAATFVPAADDPALGGQQEQQARRDAERARPALALAEGDLLAEAGHPLGEVGRRRLAEIVECLERFALHRIHPTRRVVGDAGALEHPVQALALADGDVDGGRGVDDGSKCWRHDKHRPAHAEDLDQRPIVVQRPLDVCVREIARPGPQLHVHRRRVRRVDPGHAVGEAGEIRRSESGGEVVSGPDAPPALRRVDPMHGRGGYPAPRPELR